MTILEEICLKKRAHVEACKARIPLDDLEDMVEDNAPPCGFIEAIKTHDQPAIIAEVKKASPSKGLIRPDFDPVNIAKTYEANGAACLSVLTDVPYFQGADVYLEKIKMHVDVPVLRKDFMIDPYQIYESRVLNADCVLLIMACLDDGLARELYDLSVALGMDVLVEVHDRTELDRALRLEPAMIGVNNRNLKTMEVDVQTSFALAEHIPENVISISESGLYDYQAISDLQNAGYHGFLVGESLMRQENVGTALQKLRGKS